MPRHRSVNTAQLEWKISRICVQIIQQNIDIVRTLDYNKLIVAKLSKGGGAKL